ncbi:MAG: TIGR02186 family protein, partial [Polymorphobacter sp.]
MNRLLALLAIWLVCGAAAPVRLITDISQSRIDIIYTFKGAELLVFGAIQYANGQVPDEAPGLVVVMRGPAEPITVRKKARVAGIWVNTRSARFESAPGFYAVATSKPIADLVDQRTATIW